MEDKLNALKARLSEYKRVVIAFSGGVDSSFLLYRASRLNNIEMAGATIKTTYIPEIELGEAVEFAKGSPVLQGEGNSMEVRKIAKGDGVH